MLPSTVNYSRSMERMLAKLLISLKLILFAMEMEDKTRTHCYNTAQALQLIFLRNKLISCTLINYIWTDINFKEKHNNFMD